MAAPGTDDVADGRIAGYDLARGLAVVGMIIVNFTLVMESGDGEPSWLRASVAVLEGKAAATFVVLAGVGISLLSRVARATDDRTVLMQARGLLLWRAAFLFIVGLAYVPIWPGDILHFYGVYLVFAALALRWSDRALWTGVFVANAIFVVLLMSFDYETGWDWKDLAYLDLWTPVGMVRHLFYNGLHPVFPWVGFLFAGMWLGRQDMGAVTMRRAILTMGILMLAGGTLASGLLAGLLAADPGISEETANALAGSGPMPPTPIYFTVGLGAALAVIAGSVEIGRRSGGSLLVRALTAAGRMSLTVYVAHVVIGMGLLQVSDRLYNQPLGFALGSAFVVIGASIAFAYRWLQRFDRGPLEMLMRAVTG